MDFSDYRADLALKRKSARSPDRSEELGALRASERRLRALIDRSWDVIAEISADGKLLYMSPASLRVFGYTYEELAARGSFDLIHPDDVPHVAATFANFLQTPGDTRSFEYRYLHKSGAWRWVEGIATNLVDEPSVGSIIVNYRDFTEKKLAGERLAESEERFRKLIEHSWEAVAMLDMRGTVIYASPASARIVGYEQEEFVGRSVFDFIHPEDLEKSAGELGALLALPGGTTNFSFRYRHKDGTWRWLEGAATNLLDEPGVGALIANFRDITDIRNAARDRDELFAREQASRRSAEAANRAKDEFLAMLSHELRNPLSAVRNAIVAARLDPTQRERALEIAARQTDQLTRMIDDLLDVARITNGRITLRRVRMELSHVIAHALQTTRPVVEDRGHVIVVANRAPHLELEADAARLEQVLVNLIENAAKFSGPGRQIDLVVEEDGGRAVVRVRDSGIGIAPDVLPRVFELFAQADHSLQRSQGGLGIGLTLVKRITELHGGTVEAMSAGLGAGAEFIVRLPSAPPVERSEDASARDSAARAPLRLFLVEDNPDAAESLTMLLRISGHEVRIFADGLAAIENAAKTPPDVMLVDIGLPGIDGYEVARRVRRHPQLGRMPLVALTGYGSQDDKREATSAGFDQHLVKPVDPATLHEVLERYALPAGGQSGSVYAIT